MKLGKALLVVAFLALGAGSAFAQSIGVFADAAGTDCDGTISGFGQLYLILLQGPDVPDGITGAEFFVRGLPQTWSAFVTPGPNVNIALGHPFLMQIDGTERFNVTFPACQPYTAGMILLATVTVIPNSVVGETYLQTEIADPPTNPVYTGPIVTLCDPPLYTARVVQGGAFIMNGRPCTIAVQDKTWGQVKSLFGN